jgi:hypothetical protein
MDFVVSKVAMSVCALLVAGCLSEIVGTSTGPDPDADLASLLEDLQGDVSSMAALRGECCAAWPVPRLPTGAPVDLSVAGGSACAASGGEARWAEMWPYPHTWDWDGAPVNWTTVANRDDSAAGVRAVSGDTLWIRFESVQVDDADALLLFVSLSAPSP